MSKPVELISLARLALTFLPVAVVVGVLYRWSLGAGTTLYAMGRMLLQLLLVGYVLTYVFTTDQPWLVGGVLTGMLTIASWIALRPLQGQGSRQYAKALGSIALGGVFTLLLVTQCVLDTQPWFSPSKVIPLAGMIFANSMTAISLAAERFYAELPRAASYEAARGIALRAALIPITNSLFAVGLVSLPGMMTGQILANVDPLIAARYQIMVMAMLFGSAGISAACYLTLIKPKNSVMN
ncbi:MAG: ABC transporter permease [Planctomycetes bacterium]|nr:ABC transporter permease [Planctomycetota bacterium]